MPYNTLHGLRAAIYHAITGAEDWAARVDPQQPALTRDPDGTLRPIDNVTVAFIDGRFHLVADLGQPIPAAPDVP